jgi:hypothetical protein
LRDLVEPSGRPFRDLFRVGVGGEAHHARLGISLAF